MIFICKTHSQVGRGYVVWNASGQPLCPWCHVMLDTEPMPLSVALKASALAGPFTGAPSDPATVRRYNQQADAAAAAWPLMLKGIMDLARQNYPGAKITQIGDDIHVELQADGPAHVEIEGRFTSLDDPVWDPKKSP